MSDIDSLLDELEILNSTKRRDTRCEDIGGEEEGYRGELTKCIIPYIGGMTIPGLCPTLRCIQCDFKVIRIEESQWLPNTDYLFLRTYMPNEQKLKKQLEKCDNAAAYGCQCTFVTAKSRVPVSAMPNSTWVCSGHEKKI